jgi:putative transcriptional regulator
MTEHLKTTMKVERAKRDLTQAELANLAGVTRKSINAIEMGHMVPSTILALKLAKVLGVTVEELFSLETTPD